METATIFTFQAHAIRKSGHLLHTSLASVTGRLDHLGLSFPLETILKAEVMVDIKIYSLKVSERN